MSSYTVEWVGRLTTFVGRLIPSKICCHFGPLLVVVLSCAFPPNCLAIPALYLVKSACSWPGQPSLLIFGPFPVLVCLSTLFCRAKLSAGQPAIAPNLCVHNYNACVVGARPKQVFRRILISIVFGGASWCRFLVIVLSFMKYVS